MDKYLSLTSEIQTQDENYGTEDRKTQNTTPKNASYRRRIRYAKGKQKKQNATVGNGPLCRRHNKTRSIDAKKSSHRETRQGQGTHRTDIQLMELGKQGKQTENLGQTREKREGETGKTRRKDRKKTHRNGN